jgi:hypothetical protein
MDEPERSPADSGAVFDPGIPTLHMVLDPVRMAEHLRRVLPGRCGSVREVRTRILKRHRTRCTFEIEWSSDRGSGALIGKVYGKHRGDVFLVMEAVRRAGLGSEGTFSIPEPLAYIPELRLLLLEKIRGPRVKQVLLAASELSRVDVAEGCAEWLARFQAVAPRVGEPYRADDILDSLDEWLQPLAAAGGVLGERARRLREQLDRAARRLAPTEPCASHSEYTCGQVLRSEERTVAEDSAVALGMLGTEMLASERFVTCDWDDYATADPSRDAACFVVDLKRLAWKNPGASAGFHQAADVFLKTYLARCRRGAGRNLPFYAAARCLRLAQKDIGDQEPEKAANMLDEGLRFLEI